MAQDPNAYFSKLWISEAKITYTNQDIHQGSCRSSANMIKHVQRYS